MSEHEQLGGMAVEYLLPRYIIVRSQRHSDSVPV